MGFGHRAYKNYDPRATIIKQTAHDGLRGHGQEPRSWTSPSSSRRWALSDDYFKSPQALPETWTSYSGLIYQAMDFPVEMFTVLFAIPRTSAGWRTGSSCSATRSRRSRGPARRHRRRTVGLRAAGGSGVAIR